MSVVCVLIPRFALLSAAGGIERGDLTRRNFGRQRQRTRYDLLSEPLALAPEPDREQLVGETSGPAEALGVHPGMRLSEAFARCPELRLVAADPERAVAAWDVVLAALEGIGAAVESRRPGEAYFEADVLRRLHGGHLEGVLARARAAVKTASRLGAGPSRFCSFAAAGRARSRRRAVIVPAGAARAFLAPLPLGLLHARPELAPPDGLRFSLPSALERLGVRTLGELAALPEAAVADRFGFAGLRARELALGRDSDLRPRPLREQVVERIDLPDAASGLQLERVLELLIDRLLAHPERRGRALLKLRLGARFVEQGTWRREVTLRQPTVAPERLRLALSSKLTELPAPIEQLNLAAVSFGPPVSEQLGLRDPDGSERRNRLVEALHHARAAAGPQSILRVLEVDPGSRIPERRAVLTPFPE